MRSVTRLLLLLVVLLLPVAALARPEVPKLETPVTDTAALLSPQAAQELKSVLLAYQDRTGHQFAFLSVPDLDGTTIEDFGQEVATAWRLGDKKRDDGLILLVARTERAVRVEVGYGLEGAVPDAVAARVIRDTIIPAFRRGEFDQGVRQGIDQLMRAAQGESLGPEQQPRGRSRGSWLRLLPILFILLLVFGSMGGGGRRRRLGGLGGFGGFPLGGGFGGGRSFGGGGFGGFSGGGGGFGGGGASGRW